MKSALKWCVVPLLATTLMAQTAAKPKNRKAAAKPAEPAATAADVQALRDAVAAQQRQIEELKQMLQQRDQQWQQSQQQLQQAQTAASEAQQKAATAETAASGQKDTVAKLSSDLEDVKLTLTNNATGTQDEQKRVSALEGLVGRFRLTGDIRVRGESFFQGAAGTATEVDRQRARLRVRFGFEGKLNEDFMGGLSIATGTLGDPTSTNTTMTNFFDKHTIGLDKAYIVWNPRIAKWVTVTSGKFAYTWNRTPQTFDSYLNPEGFTAKFSYDTKTPYLKNVSFQPILMLFNESSSGTDSYAVGGQVSGRLQFWRLTTTPSFTLLKWNNPDAILAASAFAVQTSPGEGPGCQNPSGVSSPDCVFAPNRLTNATYTDGSGRAHFFSQFLYADFVLNSQIKTPIARLPVNIVLEYLNNLDAKDHPLGPTGNLTVLNNLGKQSHLYFVDVSLGQTRNKNDIQFGYAWTRQEQDSVIASFVESDQRAPTNIVQNRFYVNWKMHSNLTASYTLWVGRTLNSNLQHAVLSPGVNVGEEDALLKRMQFDLVYSF